MFQQILDTVEGALVELAVRLAGWLAPLPAAYAAYRAGVDLLDWPPAVAVGAAVAVETLGLATTGTALTLWRYNLSKRKSEPSAPTGYALALVGVYFIASLSLVLLVHKFASLVSWVPGLFPVLSLAGVGTLALRADHTRRLADNERQRAERSAARRRKQAAPVPVAAVAGAGTGASRQRAAAILAEQPNISGSELGRLLGRSERLGRKLKAEIGTNGRESVPEVTE